MSTKVLLIFLFFSYFLIQNFLFFLFSQSRVSYFFFEQPCRWTPCNSMPIYLSYLENMFLCMLLYPWFKFYFLLFQTNCHTLPYPKTKLNIVRARK